MMVAPKDYNGSEHFLLINDIIAVITSELHVCGDAGVNIPTAWPVI
jgi:hypothetical protein